MDPSLLQQFRQQLATWIEARLESQRLPFQRLELCPRTLTELGRLTPDLVLWINRDSQLAGSMILLPSIVDGQVLSEGSSLAKALGLGHFTTWAAREVSIWSTSTQEPTLLHSFPLPPANRITPDDFQRTLEELLDQLKVITVTNAPAMEEYSAHYFANLCLRNLQELAPGLTMSTRIAAGQTAADEWVKLAPREKAWMSLWRILFLLRQRRLPPGLQPERLDRAVHYALSDLTEGALSWLDVQDHEPPLQEEDAVRLHHLAGRLRQLGWPQDDKRAQELVSLLLEEAAHRFGLNIPKVPWDVETAKLWVACQPHHQRDSCSLIAPRTYLAGWAFKTSLSETTEVNVYSETLSATDPGIPLPSAVAVLHEAQPLKRQEREDRLIRLRQVWPSRRFDLGRETPGWLWDALYLTGMISTELSLSLPRGWHCAPGSSTLWDLLLKRYHLVEISNSGPGEQALRFTERTSQAKTLRVHRNGQVIDVPSELADTREPGATQVWLNATDQVVALLREKKLIWVSNKAPGHDEPSAWGIFIYLQTRLGRYLWDICSDQASVPGLEACTDAAQTLGVPVPNELLLSDLSLVGSPETGAIPEPEALERELINIFGFVPEVPDSTIHQPEVVPKARRRSRVPFEQVSAKVFQDGIPLFPDHYLMDIYRPELTQYELYGPLEITGAFFDRISLRGVDNEQTIEVSGKLVAEALILASYSEGKKVSLPADEQILEDIVRNYRSDLEQLWNNLTKECRSVEPHRKAAIKLARKIWQLKGLPPESTQGA